MQHCRFVCFLNGLVHIDKINYLTPAACYEIPTCYDQEYLEFWDTHGVDETLFDMKFPFPKYHFPTDFPVVQHDGSWSDLTWSLDETDLSEGMVVQNEVDGRNEGINVRLPPPNILS